MAHQTRHNLTPYARRFVDGVAAPTDDYMRTELIYEAAKALDRAKEAGDHVDIGGQVELDFRGFPKVTGYADAEKRARDQFLGYCVKLGIKAPPEPENEDDNKPGIGSSRPR